MVKTQQNISWAHRKKDVAAIPWRIEPCKRDDFFIFISNSVTCINQFVVPIFTLLLKMNKKSYLAVQDVTLFFSTRLCNNTQILTNRMSWVMEQIIHRDRTRLIKGRLSWGNMSKVWVLLVAPQISHSRFWWWWNTLNRYLVILKWLCAFLKALKHLVSRMHLQYSVGMPTSILWKHFLRLISINLHYLFKG